MPQRLLLISTRPTLQRVERHPRKGLTDLSRVQVGSDLATLLTVPHDAGEDVVEEDGVAGYGSRM